MSHCTRVWFPHVFKAYYLDFWSLPSPWVWTGISLPRFAFLWWLMIWSISWVPIGHLCIFPGPVLANSGFWPWALSFSLSLPICEMGWLPPVEHSYRRYDMCYWDLVTLTWGCMQQRAAISGATRTGGGRPPHGLGHSSLGTSALLSSLSPRTQALAALCPKYVVGKTFS